jgi:hypothetical protein
MIKNRRARSITLAGLAALLSLTCAMPAYARSVKSSLTENRLEDEEKKQKKSATMAVTVNSSERSRLDINSLLSYNVRQDIAQAREPKSATHRLSASMTVTLFEM